MRKIIIALIIAGVFYGAWKLDDYRWRGGFKTLEPHFAGTCKDVTGVPGPEDITINQATGLAYIIARPQGKAGTIYTYDLNSPNPQLVAALPEMDNDFRPHGISLYRNEDGEARLFVITHPPGGTHPVRIFDIHEDGSLEYVKTVTDPMLRSPNDMVAVDMERFYSGNDRKNREGVMAWIESTFRLSLSDAVYYDGEKFSLAVDGLGYANGLNVSPDGNTVVVASSFDHSVHVYDRNIETGALTERTTIPTGGRIDNVESDDRGGWVITSRAQYFDGPQPTQVDHATPRDDGGYDVKTIYLNTGEPMPRGSVAAMYGRNLLIGSSGGDKVLHCVMDPGA